MVMYSQASSSTASSPESSRPHTMDGRRNSNDLESGITSNETSPLLANGGRRSSSAHSKVRSNTRQSTMMSFKQIREEARWYAWGDRLKRFTQQGEAGHWRTVGIPKYVMNKVLALLYANYTTWLLPFVPLGIIAGALGWSDPVVFVLNFCAIIPLAALLGVATEDIAKSLGETLGGLLNATFGNAVELIVSIIALLKGEIRIVQASMLGSILSNILLVLGASFLAGGITRYEQEFNSTAATTLSSLMAVATSSLMIPAALYATLPSNDGAHVTELVLQLSRGTAIVMLILYVLYLLFQLKTHVALFDDINNEEDDKPRILTTMEGLFVLALITVVVSICADYLVGSIEGLVETWNISKTFVGLIMIPVVGNAAEHMTAVMVAMNDRMNLAIGIAMGSGMQIAMLMTPFLVLLGWIKHQPMSLHFQTFETVILFISTYLSYHVIQDGKSNYLEGAMLIGMYLIIGVAFFVYPDNAAGGL